MMRACPDCGVAALQEYRRPRLGADGFIVAEMCDRCEGVWVAGADLGAVHPALPGIHAWCADGASRGAALRPSGSACRKCARALVRVSFYGARLGYCPSGCGVWI